ncbi:MAG: hypothetical protein IJV19_04390 [Prevotella sp.]|nr:hypothetical protein [Prevotella sp.]
MLDKIDIMKLNELPIEQVATALGLSVSHHKALCPFHNDSNPSLTFNVRKNRYARLIARFLSSITMIR